MMLGHEQRDTSTYTAHNGDKSARSLVIKHPAREGWKLSEKSPKPAETSSSFLRFQLPAAPGAAEKFEIEESHLDYVQDQLTHVDDQQVALLIQDGSLTQSAQGAWRRALDQKNQVERFRPKSIPGSTKLTPSPRTKPAYARIRRRSKGQRKKRLWFNATRGSSTSKKIA